MRVKFPSWGCLWRLVVACFLWRIGTACLWVGFGCDKLAVSLRNAARFYKGVHNA
jgi:hypothetical protein